MKVSKKDERLARGICAINLYLKRVPTELISDKVDKHWPGSYYQAKLINQCMRQIDNYSLDGQTTEEEIEKSTDRLEFL